MNVQGRTLRKVSVLESPVDEPVEVPFGLIPPPREVHTQASPLR